MTKPKRYCHRGHDTHKVGRTPSHSCRECKRILAREWIRNRRLDQLGVTGTFRFPAPPLRDRVLAEAEKYAGPNGTNGTWHLGELYALRFGLTEDEGRAAIGNVLRDGRKYVKEETADKWCVFLGIHPVQLWPQEWPLAEVGV